MRVEGRGIVLPQSAWAYLLQWQGVQDGWMLPFSQTPDLAQGQRYLLAQDCLLLTESQAALDSTLERVSSAIASASKVLDVWMDRGPYSFLFTGQGRMLAARLPDGRIRVSPVSTPLMESLSALVGGRPASYMLRSPQSRTQEQALHWQEAVLWLPTQFQEDD